MKTIAFANFKGGVGKTMVCYNVGGFLALRGKRVLFIDMDIQSNLTENTGLAAKLRNDLNLDDVEIDWDAPKKKVFRITENDALKNIGHVMMWENTKPSEVIYPLPRMEKEAPEYEQNLSIILSDYSLRDTENLLPLEHVNSYIKRLDIWIDKYRNILEKNFDYILIDVGPYTGNSTYNALYASDVIYLVTDLSDNAYRGMFALYQDWKKICDSDKEEVNIKGIIINKYNTRTKGYTDKQENYLRNTMKSKYASVFKNEIHESVPLRKSETEKPLAFKQDSATKNSQGYISFSKLIDEMIERGL